MVQPRSSLATALDYEAAITRFSLALALTSLHVELPVNVTI